MKDYEESASFLGTWGPFQRRVFFLICLTSIPSGYNLLCVIFLLASPPHYCHVPAHNNLSEDWIKASIPVQGGGQSERSSCSRYELDLVRNLSAAGVSIDQFLNQSVLGLSPGTLKQEDCKEGWTYSTEYYQSTAVTEFDLVCRDEWKQPLSSFVYFLGGLCGCLVFGQLADRFGRKPILFSSFLMLSVFSCALAFAPNWPVFTVLLFLLGMGQIASYIIGFVLGSEILIGSARVIFNSLGFPISYAASMILLTGTAYLVRNWRYLSLMLTVPGLACIPLWCLIPESPRWLLANGRLQEAELVLRSAAAVNQVQSPHLIFTSASVEKTDESYSILDLLRTSNIRNIIFILWIMWFSASVSYFGVSFNTSSLHGDPYLNYFLLSTVELPAYFAVWVTLRKLPRRQLFIGFMLLGTVALLLIQVTQHSHAAFTLALVLLGKFGILAGNGVMYVFAGELSPTVIRNTAMSSCAMFSRLGSSISPYLLELAVFYHFLPWIVVCGVSLLGILLCVFLPETFGQPLPDTIQQMAPTRRFWMPWTFNPVSKDDEKPQSDEHAAIDVVCSTQL